VAKEKAHRQQSIQSAVAEAAHNWSDGINERDNLLRINSPTVALMSPIYKRWRHSRTLREAKMVCLSVRQDSPYLITSLWERGSENCGYAPENTIRSGRLPRFIMGRP
jgi:hypothetical protein